MNKDNAVPALVHGLKPDAWETLCGKKVTYLGPIYSLDSHKVECPKCLEAQKSVDSLISSLYNPFMIGKRKEISQ